MFGKWLRRRRTEKLLALAMRQAELERMRPTLTRIIDERGGRGDPVLDMKIMLVQLDQQLGDVRSEIAQLEAKLGIKATDLVAKLEAIL